MKRVYESAPSAGAERSRSKGGSTGVRAQMESELYGVADERAPLTNDGQDGAGTGAMPPKRAGFFAVSIAIVTLCLVGFVAYLSFAPGISLFSFHPLCMTIGWLLLMTSGINAFSPTDIALQWMPIQNRTTRHWVIQATALLFIATGFVIIETNKFLANKAHFATLHGIFGLASIVLALITGSGGIFTLYSMKFKKLIAPVYIKLMHSTIGLLTYLMGIVTMIIIFFSGWWYSTNGNETLRVIFLVLLLFVTFWSVLRPLIKLYARFRERLDYIRASN